MFALRYCSQHTDTTIVSDMINMSDSLNTTGEEENAENRSREKSLMLRHRICDMTFDGTMESVKAIFRVDVKPW